MLASSIKTCYNAFNTYSLVSLALLHDSWLSFARQSSEFIGTGTLASVPMTAPGSSQNMLRASSLGAAICSVVRSKQTDPITGAPDPGSGFFPEEIQKKSENFSRKTREPTSVALDTDLRTRPLFATVQHVSSKRTCVTCVSRLAHVVRDRLGDRHGKG